jgi:hypothetical protein
MHSLFSRQKPKRSEIGERFLKRARAEAVREALAGLGDLVEPQ